MSASHALTLALEIHREPALAAAARQAPLPADIGQLLALLPGHRSRLEPAAAEAGVEPEQLLAAVRHYVREAMLHPDAEDARLLGLGSQANAWDLKHHHRALQAWLHPDRDGAPDDAAELAARVNAAWTRLRGNGLASVAEVGRGGRPRPHWRKVELEPARQRRPAWRGLAAAIAVVAVGVLGGWFLREPAPARVPVSRPVAVLVPGSALTLPTEVIASPSADITGPAKEEVPPGQSPVVKSVVVADLPQLRFEPAPMQTPVAAITGLVPAAPEPVAMQAEVPEPVAAPGAVPAAVPAAGTDVALVAAPSRQIEERPSPAALTVTVPVPAPVPEAASAPGLGEKVAAEVANEVERDRQQGARLHAASLYDFLALPQLPAPPIWRSGTALDQAERVRKALADGVHRRGPRVLQEQAQWRFGPDQAQVSVPVQPVAAGAPPRRLQARMQWYEDRWWVTAVALEDGP